MRLTALARRALLPIVSCLIAANAAAQQAPHIFGLFPTNSTKLYYEVAGAGPAVVLLHGGWLNSRQWDDQFPVLARKYRVVRYDVRGAGRSPIGDSAFAHSEDLAALLKGLGIERAHLIGLSAGGQIAIDFALTHPGSVRSLVIGASPLRGYDLGPEFTNGIRGIVTAGAADSIQLVHDRMWAFAPFRVAGTMPGVRDRLNAMILQQNTWPGGRPGAPRPRFLEPPPAARLAEIRVPVLIIVGEGEMPALVKEAQFVAQGIAGARLITVRNAGHFVNLEQPDRYSELILEWLEQREKR